MSLTNDIDEVLTNKSNTNLICREFQLKPSAIATYICALANTETGYVIIGATYEDQNFHLNGISPTFNFQNIVDNALKLLSFKPDIEYEVLNKGNKHLFVIKVHKTLKSILVHNSKYMLEDSEIIKCKEEIILDTTKVFIVHGHDNEAKYTTARFVERLGLEAIILHEQASKGKTIIEKIEEHSNVGFAIVLYTSCDVGKSKDEQELKSRARQNVVFEHGYLIGKIGRENVCALVKGQIEKPNDISGVVYIDMDIHGAWTIALAREMKSVGYQIDMNKI